MTLLARRNPSPRPTRTGVVGGIALVVLVAYAVPFLGFVASLALPLLTHLARRRLWPEASTARSILWSLLAWVGLWLPGVVGFFVAGAGVTVSTTWLMLPLCAPTGPGAVLLPALAAAALCLAGLYAATATRTGWTWVIAAWLAPWAHFLVFALLPHEFIC